MLILTTFSPLCAELRQIKADAYAKNKIFGKQNSNFSWAYMLNESSFLYTTIFLRNTFCLELIMSCLAKSSNLLEKPH